jgi:uncharacterized protein (TIRG00374 family)
MVSGAKANDPGTADSAPPARGPRLFSSVADARRTRRPTDVIVLAIGLLIIAALWWPSPGPTGVDSDLARLLRGLGGVWNLLWDLSYAFLVIWPLLLIVIVVASRGRRRLLIDLTMGALSAAGLAFVIGDLVGTSWSDSFHSLTSSGPPQIYLGVRFAIATAVIETAAPHLARPLRLSGDLVLLLGAFSAVALGVAYPVGILAGFAVGLVAAAFSHLLLGSPGGELSTAQVTRAVAELGIVVTGTRLSRVQTPGVVMMVATGEDGRQLLVKVFGRDAWDSQFLGSMWAAVVRRGERPSLGRSRQGQLEHEALATLVAERAGVPVWSEVKVGSTADGDAVLVSRIGGRNLHQLSPEEIDDAVLKNAWRSLAKLHEVGISHGRIDSHRLFVEADARLALADFAEADLVATDDAKLTDLARMLVTTAACSDDERAVDAALAVLGAQKLAEVLPYLQPAVLDRETRQAIKTNKRSLESLRSSAAGKAGVDLPPLQKVNRLTWKSLAIAVGGTLLAYYLITKLLGINFSSVIDELKTANWWWASAALLVSPTIQAIYAVGTIGASSKPVRYFPVLMLQYAIQFLAVTIPSAAAKYALDVRFFQKFGLAASAALSVGVIDSFSGFTVQLLLIAVIALTALPGLTSPLMGPSSSGSASTASGSSLAVVALWLLGIVLVTALTVWLIPALRHKIKALVPQLRASIKEQYSNARGALVVLRQPRNLSLMFAGNLGAQVVQGLVLGLCLHAFGKDAHLSQMVLINTLVMLFAGFMPVPGGVGVAEAGYVACLQAIGIPSAVAMSTALLYRLVTFYLPPIWGGFAMRWLKRHQYV